ncbi:hypothetical protein QPK87_23495 [Kamptonema cortianum]|nr:hypothetical protein [Kamptonema cortianum]
MLKKSVSYLVLGSFLLMDAASCMEPEDKGPSSPPRSPSFLRNPSEPSVSPASSSSSLSDLDPQERLKAISSLPWHERNRLYAELALKEDTPMTLRREAFSSVHSTDLLDEPTREGLKSLRTIFLNAEDLPFKERFAFLRDSSAPPVATLLSLARALDLEEDVSYSEWEIYRLAELLMDYDHTETQQGIETCFFKKPKFFFNHRSWEGWLSTTLETSDESKRASMLQKLREVMQSTEIVTNIVYIAKFILKHSQNVEDKGTTLETFLNIAAQQTASHSETPREQFLRQKRDMSDACKALLPHVPEDKTALLRTLSEEMLQQVCTDISAIIDPQERLQTISILPYGGDLRDRFYAELALQEDIPTALRQKAFFSIYSTNSLDEATRKMLGNLIITFLSDDEPIDPHEILTMISMLPWNERNLPYAEFSLQEDIPMALRREAFSSIYLTDSLDEIARRRLENLKATFLSDEELSLQERLKFLPNADEEAPPIATLLSLTHALESANEESYNESNIRSLINFLMDCNSSESQLGIERCYFKQPELFLDGSVWEEWLRTTLETGDKSKRTSMLQKIHEVMHSIEDVTKIANLAKFILQHSQDAVDKETALGTFFNVATQSNTAHSEMPQEQSLRQKLDISDACKALLPHVPEDKATLLRTFVLKKCFNRYVQKFQQSLIRKKGRKRSPHYLGMK